MNIEKILTSKATIRFQDCDPFQHLNNSKYIDYIINAREDQIKQHYGFDIYDILRKEGISWVVTANQISYLRPAVVMEEVIIETQLIELTKKSLTVEGRMWDKNRKHLKCVQWTSMTHYDIQAKSSRQHKEEFQTFFNTVLAPISDPSFEERIKNIKMLNVA